MPLKVLLADDSAAIKKVMQLSLQDYGVDVRTVASGKDVADVARQFSPDLAFVDVLLPGKTGYDVAAEFKADPLLKKLPVILLWSAFMAFDEGKFKGSGAVEHLEKPFEVAALRALVNKHVPQTLNHPLARHLEFPKLEFDLASGTVVPSKMASQAPTPRQSPTGKPSQARQAPADPPPPGRSGELPPTPQEWGEANFDSLPSAEKTASFVMPPATEDEEAGWVRKDLSRFKVDSKAGEAAEWDSLVPSDVPEVELKDTNFLLQTNSEIQKPEESGTSEFHIPADDIIGSDSGELEGFKDTPPPAENKQLPVMEKPQSQASSEVKAIDEEALRRQIEEAVEKAVWKMVPEIAANIIREEIHKLLNEDSNP